MYPQITYITYLGLKKRFLNYIQAVTLDSTVHSTRNSKPYPNSVYTDAGTKYDVLSFLYSVVLTKGPNRIVNERQDMEESLIGNHTKFHLLFID
jgi:hypothetical protein